MAAELLRRLLAYLGQPVFRAEGPSCRLDAQTRQTRRWRSSSGASEAVLKTARRSADRLRDRGRRDFGPGRDPD